jgi:hypothetical protein
LVVRVAWVGSSSPFGTCTGVVRRSA